MYNFFLHSGNTRFPFFPLFLEGSLLLRPLEKMQMRKLFVKAPGERKRGQLLPRVFLGKWEIFAFKCIYSAKESLHSLWRMVLEEIKFQLHLHITPTPASSSDQLAVSCTNITDELLWNHQDFSLIQERGTSPTPAHNRLPVAAKPQAGDMRNFWGWFQKNKIAFYVYIGWCRRIQAGCSLSQAWCRTHFSLELINLSTAKRGPETGKMGMRDRKGRNICRHWPWKEKKWAEQRLFVIFTYPSWKTNCGQTNCTAI